MTSESEWTVYRTRFVVRARQLTDSLIFTDALGRQQSGQAGDYLVEIFDGLLSITPRKFFEDIYVPLEPVADSDIGKPASQHRAVLSDRRQGAVRTGLQTQHRPSTVVNSRGSPLNPNSRLVVQHAPAGSVLMA